MVSPGGFAAPPALQQLGLAAGSPPAPSADVLGPARLAAQAARWPDVLTAIDQVTAATPAEPPVPLEATVLRATALAALGRGNEAVASLQSARQREALAGRPGAGAMLALSEAQLLFTLGQGQLVITALTEAANGFASAGDVPSQMQTQLQLAGVCAGAGQVPLARQIIAGCVAEAQRRGDPALLALARQQEGALHIGMAELAAASASFQDGLAAADRCADQGLKIQLRMGLALALSQSDPARASALLAEAEALAHAAADLVAGALALASVAGTWRMLGRGDDSARCAEQACGTFRAAQAWPALAHTELGLADLYACSGRPDLAKQRADEALAIASRLGRPAGQATALATLGQYAMARGDQPAARSAFAAAISHLQAAQLPVPPALSAAFTQLGGAGS